VPTLVAPHAVLGAVKNGAQLPPSVVAKAQEVIEAHQASFARAVAAGVKEAMGTDSGVGPHGSNLDELSLVAAGGMTPSDVLVATTSSAAQLLGLAAQTGSLTPGKRRRGRGRRRPVRPGRTQAAHPRGLQGRPCGARAAGLKERHSTERLVVTRPGAG
jgi:hypothetical protein